STTLELGTGTSDASNRSNTSLPASMYVMPYSVPEKATRGHCRLTPSFLVTAVGPETRAPVPSVFSTVSSRTKGDSDTTSSMMIVYPLPDQVIDGLALRCAPTVRARSDVGHVTGGASGGASAPVSAPAS